MRRVILAAVAALALCAAAPLGGPGSAPEPDGLWMGAIPGYTPSTLKGAEVTDDASAVQALIEKGAVLIDVAEQDRRPASLPAGTIWRPQHRSIPDAIWFPGAAPGDLAPEREAVLKARVEALTGGDKAKPIVAFCRPDCWGSWNMGKRLVMWGYTKVTWFPRGFSAWQEAEKPTAIIAPDPEWMASAKTDGER